jgi:hypothetical protein
VGWRGKGGGKKKEKKKGKEKKREGVVSERGTKYDIDARR